MLEINQGYQQKEMLANIKKAFVEQKPIQMIQLQQFLSIESYKDLVAQLQQLDYEQHKEPIDASLHVAELSDELFSEFNSEQMLNFVSEVIGKKVKRIQVHAQRVDWKDYMLLSDDPAAPGYDIYFDATIDWDAQANGVIIYTVEDKHVQLPIISNSLFLINRAKGIDCFFKYANHYAKGKERYIIKGSLEF